MAMSHVMVYDLKGFTVAKQIKFGLFGLNEENMPKVMP